jgi:hypothetical protein
MHTRLWKHLGIIQKYQKLSEAFSDNPPRLIIGETYFFEDIDDKGLAATVTTATVDETRKIMYIGTDKGHVLTRPMSDDELTDYRNHRDAFFGIIHKQGKKTNNEYEFFEELVAIHMSYPKSSTHKQMEDWGYSADELEKLSHEDLVLEYCEGIVAQLRGANQSIKPNVDPDDGNRYNP